MRRLLPLLLALLPSCGKSDTLPSDLPGLLSVAKESRDAAEKALAPIKQSATSLTAEIAAAPAKLTALEASASAAATELDKAKEGMTAKGPASTALAEASAKAAEAAAS